MALKFSTGLRNKLLGININKVTNGSFTTDVTGWTPVDAVLSSVSGGQSGNCLQIAESGGTNPGKAYQDIETKAGHLYILEVYFKRGTSASGKVMIGTTSDENAIWDTGNLTYTTWTKVPGNNASSEKGQIVFEALEATTRITLQSNDTANGTTSFFDEVKCISLARSIQDLFSGCYIKIYTGTQPSSPDAAPTGTLLVTIDSQNNTGLHFDDATGGVLVKKATETWSGTAVATGTAGWFRIIAKGDSGGASTTDERIDGACGTAGAELTMSSTAIVQGAVQSISTFQLVMNQ